MSSINKIIEFTEKKYSQNSFQNEDRIVFNFLKKFSNRKLEYLEAGSGTGRFPEILSKKYPNLLIKCIEINKELVNITKAKGLDTIQGNIIETTFKDSEFDIVHCSHVIEHLGYPQIADTLDELVRIIKKDGYLIIRSPLMYPGFYFDIDHVRPYPPESIFNYFNNVQQQKTGKNKIKKIKIWYRREALSLNFSPNVIKRLINFSFRIMWTYIRFPFSKRNGYILILKKE